VSEEEETRRRTKRRRTRRRTKRRRTRRRTKRRRTNEDGTGEVERRRGER
jgi:hypothetical protein